MYQVTVINVGDVFSRFFLYISTHISLVFLSLGGAEGNIERGKTEQSFDGKLCEEYSHQKL